MNPTPTQDLILELLAARHRLGENIWTLTANTPVHTALKHLEKEGLVGWKSGIVEKTYLAWLTEAGKAEYIDPAYVAPILQEKENTALDNEVNEDYPVGEVLAAQAIAEVQQKLASDKDKGHDT